MTASSGLASSPSPGRQIRLNRVTYSYPVKDEPACLDQVDLTIRSGEYLLISGASGSGKSTLARTFNGLIPHFYGGRLSGTVLVDSRATTGLSVADLFDRVGLVFQNAQAQLFNRSVIRELAFGLESLGLPPMAMNARISAVAKELDITHLLESDPQTLSGGEQQLVTLASVLVLRPGIVVLDEPLANLDAAHSSRLRTLLMQLKAQGTGVVVCEHRMRSTLPDADRVVLIHKGRKLEDGSPQAVLASRNWFDCGVELPLATRMGLDRGMSPVPLTVSALSSCEPAWINQIIPEPLSLKQPRGGAPVLATENLTYTLGARTILEDINLTVPPGACTAIVGANGAGKTTLLKLLAGLLRPSAGQILIHGKPITGLPAWKVARHLGIAFQNPNSQFFKLTVQDEILAGPKALKCYDPLWFDQLVALFKLDRLLNRAPFKLSGGEKKRVAFAAALAAKPSILALDEPTAGQDGQFRQALIKGIARMREQGTAILIVTHALGFAQQLSDDWVVMADGRLLARNRPTQIMADPRLMRQAALEPTEFYQLRQQCAA